MSMQWKAEKLLWKKKWHLPGETIAVIIDVSFYCKKNFMIPLVYEMSWRSWKSFVYFA